MSYDLIVVGGGPDGYVAAIRASRLGKKVACPSNAPKGRKTRRGRIRPRLRESPADNREPELNCQTAFNAQRDQPRASKSGAHRGSKKTLPKPLKASVRLS